MRALVAVPLLLLGVGCHSARNSVCPPCEVASSAPAERCDKECSPLPPCEVVPSRTTVKCPPTKVEVRPAQEIHVKAPPQKVYVNAAPSQVAQQAAVPQAMPAMAAVPQVAAMPMQTAVPASTQMLVPQAAVAPQPLVASSVQTRARSRDRIAFGLDWVRIPFPIPRLFAIPGPERVVTETQFTPVGQASLPVSAAQVAATAVPVQQVAYQPAVAPMFQGQVAVAAAPQIPQTVVPAPQVAAYPAPQTVMQAQAIPAVVVAPAMQASPCGAAQALPGANAAQVPASEESVQELRRQLAAFHKLCTEAGLQQQGQPKQQGQPAP